MAGSPLIIGQAQINALHQLRDYAAQHPINAGDILRDASTPEGLAAHRVRMRKHALQIPTAFVIAYSVETGHPGGLVCRHMSMSSTRPGRAPTSTAVWAIAVHLGFVDGLDMCSVWEEDVEPGHVAINIAQPIFREGTAESKH